MIGLTNKNEHLNFSILTCIVSVTTKKYWFHKSEKKILLIHKKIKISIKIFLWYASRFV